MAKIIVEEQKEYTLLPPESILHLKVEKVNIRDVEGRNGNWQKLDIEFKVLGVVAIGDGGDPAGYEIVIGGPIWGNVPFRLTDSPENKLRQWAEAILGVELGIGAELDTDWFLGRQVRGMTSQYKKRNGNMAHQIDALLPMGDVPTPVQQVQQQQAQDPWTGQPTAQNVGWGAPGVQAQQPQYVPAPARQQQMAVAEQPQNQPSQWQQPQQGWEEPPF